MRADEIGGHRQLAPAAVGQRGQHDARRAAVVEQHVDRGAHGAAGVEHVVDQHDGGAVDVEGDMGRLDVAVQALLGVVVAVERDVDEAEAACQAEVGGQAFGQPGAAGMDADDGGVGGAGQAGAHLLEQVAVQRLGVELLGLDVGMVVKVLLQNDGGGLGVDDLAAPLAGITADE